LPPSLPRINHTGSGSTGYWGTDDGVGVGSLAMRIYATNGTAAAAAPATARKSAGGSFSVGGQEPPRSTAASGGLRAISTVDALIALQGVEDFRERKKRAVAKGRNALDALDQLKLGFLDGSVDQGMLARLKVAADGLNEGSGDAGLDAVLSEIDLRVAVELAKAGIG
jgi:Class II flagellar assembly regulator